MNQVTQPDPVELADDYSSYRAYVEGIDSIDGKTLDLIHAVHDLIPYEYTDGDCLEVIEKLLQHFHRYHREEFI